MPDTLQNLKRIPREMLEARLETVKTLKTEEHQSYEIAKDRETGEHYLVYDYFHLNVAEGGHKETFYHLMPIDTDDVLALIFGEQPYDYPAFWKKPYLRNGAEETYVWYDPSEILEVSGDETYGEQVKSKLDAFKKEGAVDEASVRKLLDELAKLDQPGD